MKNSPFFNQAELMLRCLPAVAEEGVFALKGGTAINMFLQPLPRLSVDIDLTYVPIEERTSSLKNMSEALKRIAQKIEKSVKGSTVQILKQGPTLSKLFVKFSNAIIKIEANEVIRGTTANPVKMDLVREAEELFGLSVTVPIVPLPDLYGGKICAALDRQHPRDLFDICILLKQQGITAEIRRGFLVMLASHHRPMHELLAPNPKDISEIYKNEFKAMVVNPPSIAELNETRQKLVTTLSTDITENEKAFLLSMKQGEPKWELLNVPNVDKFPGIQWKLLNITKMSVEKRAIQVKLLQNCFMNLNEVK